MARVESVNVTAEEDIMCIDPTKASTANAGSSRYLELPHAERIYPVDELHYKGYTAQPKYCPDDGIFYGKLLGIEDLITLQGTSEKEVEEDFHATIDEYLASCAQDGAEPNRPCSGHIDIGLDISPELHKLLLLSAKKAGLALDRIIEEALIARMQQDWDYEASNADTLDPAENPAAVVG